MFSEIFPLPSKNSNDGWICHLLSKALLGHNLFSVSHLWLKIITSPTIWIWLRVLITDFTFLVSWVLDCISQRWLGLLKEDNMFWRQNTFSWCLPQWIKNVSNRIYHHYAILDTYTNGTGDAQSVTSRLGIFLRLVLLFLYFFLNSSVVQKIWKMVIWSCGCWFISSRENAQRKSHAL